jgi:tripartite-type tricarboxylate transporter receptor subunit TctC
MNRASFKGAISTAIAAATVAWLGAGSAKAEPVEQFYRGKMINIIIGTASNFGATSLYARALAEMLPEHLPGNPHIIVRNMPGAGGITAANYLYSIAPQDGTYWGFITRGFVMAPLLGSEAAKFDPTKFQWIGSTAREVSVGVLWTATTPARTIQDVMKQEVIVGATTLSQDTGFFPTMLNKLAGTKFKIVNGYKSTGDIELAMEKGEVHGKIGWTWGSLNAGPTVDWLKDGKAVAIVQLGVEKAPGIPDSVPLGLDLTKSEEDRQVMRLVCSPASLGYPSFMGPGVPADRIAAMRKAFDETMANSRFIEQLKKQGMPLDPLSGIEVQKVIADIYSAPPNAVQKARELMASTK